MDLNKVRSLIEMLEDTDITEIDIEDDEFNIIIKKGIEEKITTGNNIDKSSVPDVDTENISIDKKEEIKNKENKKEDKNDKTQKINAPMVGTFYRAPAPDADPFVKTGDVVQNGDTLCIIEAMKLMNEIEAEQSGKVKEILVEDSDSVEYGQPLFILEKV